MKKLLLILSLISLPLTSAVNSLNISVNGVSPTDDPKKKSANNSESSNIIPMFLGSPLDSFLTAKYTTYYNIEVVKYNEEEEEEAAIDVNSESSLNTDTLVNEIMKISQKYPAKKLVICTGGNNKDYPTAVYGVTINETEKIRKLSKMQNKGTDKKSKCFIPKNISHYYNEDWDKNVSAVVNEINLETGEVNKKDVKYDNLFYEDINKMNISVIYTTVANINTLYDVLFPTEKEIEKKHKNQKLYH